MFVSSSFFIVFQTDIDRTDESTLGDIALSTLYGTVKKIVDKTAVSVKLEGVGFVYHVPKFTKSNRRYRFT
jgi:hypothetical protein